jgi:hypothetical protein
LGTIMVAAVLTNLFVAHRRETSTLNSEERSFFAVCVLVIAYHLVLFFYIPVRIEYLLPLLMGVAGILVVQNASSVLMVGLIIAELSYWFVSIDLLKIEYKNQYPCDAIVALSATLKPHLTPGILIPDLTNNTNELLCLPRFLLEPPANMKDRLPKPMVRGPG